MELNDVVGAVDVDTTPVADVVGAYDIVVANILAPVLIAIADDLKRLLRPGGSLVISGILADRHDHVLAALAPLAPVDVTGPRRLGLRRPALTRGTDVTHCVA